MGFKSPCVCLHVQNHTALGMHVCVPRRNASMDAGEDKVAELVSSISRGRTSLSCPGMSACSVFVPKGSDLQLQEQFRLPIQPAVRQVLPQVVGFGQYIRDYHYHFHSSLRQLETSSPEESVPSSREIPQPFTSPNSQLHPSAVESR